MIEIFDIFFRYPSADFDSLQGISLQIERGQAVSIMGANGSGKSTLARCLNGLNIPSAGMVRVDGLDTKIEAENERIRQLVGMVFQNPDNQIVSTTVEREIAFGMENLGVPYSQMHQTVNWLLKEFGLEKYRQHPPHRLSGGEKQLLALVSVLAMQPSYLILDEPTSLLDPFSRRSILETIFKHPNGTLTAVTPILITQFPEETFYTKRLIILSNGKIVFDASPQQVFRWSEDLNRIGIAVPVEFQLQLHELVHED